MLGDVMTERKVRVNYYYGKEELYEIIKKIVNKRLSANEREVVEENRSSEIARKTFKYNHIFSGILKCHECNENMSYNKKYGGYNCINSQRVEGKCTDHFVKEEYLLEIIKNNLKVYIDNNINIEELYKIENKKAITADGYKKELNKIKRELQKIENQVELMYSHDIDGSINKKNIKSLMRALQKRQQFLIIKRSYVEGLKERNEIEGNLYYESYKEEMDKMLDLGYIDKNFIESLVEKIIVSEDENLNEKKIDIYYKFKN